MDPVHIPTEEQQILLLSTPKADYHTIIGAVREFITMLLAAYFLWVSQLKEITGSTLISMILSIPFSILIALGTAYTHYEQERLHQEAKPHNTQLSSTFQYNAEAGALSYWQTILLTVTAIGHAGDFVGFLEDTTDSELNDQLKKLPLIMINIGFLLFGLLASWAEVRAVLRAMQTNNATDKGFAISGQSNENHNQTSDNFTKFSLFAKIVQTGVTNLLFYARLIDLLFGFKKNTSLDASTQGLYSAIPFTLLITFGTVFYQTFININHQDHPTLPTDSADIERKSETHHQHPTPELKCCLTVLLAGRFLGTAGDFAAYLYFLIQINLPFDLKPATQIGFLSGFLLLGLFMSVSDGRNAENNLKDYQRQYLENPAEEKLSVWHFSSALFSPQSSPITISSSPSSSIKSIEIETLPQNSSLQNNWTSVWKKHLSPTNNSLRESLTHSTQYK